MPEDVRSYFHVQLWILLHIALPGLLILFGLLVAVKIVYDRFYDN